jgi:poly-gamma-glutamate synthesis protein (capsule biosynthesis protein)
MLGRDISDLGNSFDSKFINNSKQSIFGDTLPILSGADLLIGNLETTITTHTKRYPKMFNYRINPKYADNLKLNKNMYLSIANNHIIDYDYKGMMDTMYNLERLGIIFSGAGENLNKAKLHKVFTINGKRIGIFSCADHYKYWKAGPNSPGIYYVDYNNYNDILNHIKSIRPTVDVLIMSIHWGPNYQIGIDPKYEKFGKDALKAGIDIIHGHSSHHVKCIRHNGHKLIMYGLGDFIDDYAVDEEYKNDIGMIVRVTINNNNALKVDIIPTKINDRRVNLAEKTEEKSYVYDMVQKDCKL